ncbi:neurexin-1-like isoform X2 [Portunus trituberculatus]|uniref:neurexin-1-like isoform X2 n=1 Tax=Portunus trituberculatus TaxID=210409 RepID=UPI001E1CB75C|nr:neurexin-1-like isoform X2 [Portunus trituberculatus]
MGASGWLWWCLAVPFAAYPTLGFLIEGSPTSFAQFSRWVPGTNGSLEFEFSTREPDGLLLYTDDGGSYEFFELKLVEGAVRLHYNTGGGARLLTAGRGLHDGAWHRVRVTRRLEQTHLTVDDEIETRVVKSLNHEFGNPDTNSFVYLGGLPLLLTRQVGNRLTLPVVTLEPRFAGQLRGLTYTRGNGLARSQNMIASQGVREMVHGGECDQHGPCMNGGRCYSGDQAPRCDCSRIAYEGPYCEKERRVEEITFRGREYVWWDLRRTGGQPLAAQSDHLSFSFKTRHPAGVLFFSGDGKDYVNIALREGGVLVTLDMGGDPLKVTVRPDNVRFDDNQWHRVSVHRTVKEINGHTSFCTLSVSVDGLYSKKGTTAGPFSHLSSSRLHLGGADVPALLPGAETRSNFVGCMRKVEYVADSVRLDIIRTARQGSPLLHVKGKVDYMCHEVEAGDPVSFTTQESYLDGPENGVVKFTRPDAFLVLPSWEATRQGSVSFKMRTTEPDGLLMYNSGSLAAQGDFFAVELMEGHLYLHLSLGSGLRKVKATNRRIDDGWWHEVTLNRDGQVGRITVDEGANDFTTPGDSHRLNLDGALYVGGVSTGVEVPPEVWSGRLGLGYVGCMRDLVINGLAADLASYAKKQDSGSIINFCHSDGGSCSSNPCMHGGTCKEGWGRFICDCSHTAFVGPTCGKDAATLSFDGSQYVRMFSDEESNTQAEDITFRFRTNRPVGLLLSTTSTLSSDRLELALQAGKLRLTVKLGDKDKVVHVGNGLNDQQWHSVHLVRRATQVSLQVDNETPVLDHTMGRHSILQYRDIHVGMVSNDSSAYPSPPISGSLGPIPPFIGQMQSLYINGKYVFEMARAGHLNRMEVSAVFGRGSQVVHHPVTFKSRTAYVALPQLKAYSSTNIYFQFKTLQPSGLLMYNGGKGHDFLALELINGHVHLIFSLGDRPVRVRDNNKMALNDNKWHVVTVSRPSSLQHTLLVDDTLATVTNGGSSETLDLQGFLYLGGVLPEMYTRLPRHIVSRSGFEGCMASLDLNGEAPDPAGKDVPIMANHVYSGCEGPSTKCHRNACANGGTCVQQWNSYSCNCDMTSYTGPTCSDESTSYEFNKGLLTFQYPEGRWPDSRRDLLALGFMTNQEDAVVLRLDSANSNDFMELEIVEGNVFVVYNMGTEDHPVGEIMSKVNDGMYHVVRFIRSGPNATVQIDDYEIQENNPSEDGQTSFRVLKKLRSGIWHGHQLSVFNAQSKLQVGGRRAKRSSSIERPFQGVMSGLVLNGERPLDLAAERDPRVLLEGNVHLLMNLPKDLQGHSNDLNQWQRTPPLPGPSPGEGDDLVFSGAGSGCDMDDEDECIPVFDTGSGDDLITPVYIPPTQPPSTKPPPLPQIPDHDTSGGIRPCDDEDCYIGSGSGEFNTENGGMTDLDNVDDTDLEFPPSHHPMLAPEIIHSEEDSPGSTGLGHSNSRGPGSGPTTPSRPEPTPPSSSTTTTSTHTPNARHHPTSTTTTTTTPLPPYSYPQPPLEYDYHEFGYPEMNEKGNNKGRKDDGPHEAIHSDTSGSVALVISIVAGTLIVVILIVLLVLKFKGRQDGAYKVDESKNYEGIPTVPTPMINGQGNGAIKPGDRRPVKKQSKDVKEWYV